MSNVSFHDYISVWGLGEEEHKGKCHFHSILSGVYIIKRTYTLDINLDHLDEVVFVSFLHSIVTFFPCFHTLLLGGSNHHVQPTVKLYSTS